MAQSYERKETFFIADPPPVTPHAPLEATYPVLVFDPKKEDVGVLWPDKPVEYVSFEEAARLAKARDELSRIKPH